MKLSLSGLLKVCIPIGCILLGANGLVEVNLQQDLAKKSTVLNKQVAQAKTLSGQLHQGLGGLADLKQTTEEMQGSLVNVEHSAADMATGLSTLATTVNGINTAVGQIHGGVASSKADIASLSTSEGDILSTLQTIGQVNEHIANQLGSMIANEQQIDSDLQQMNKKTALVP